MARILSINETYIKTIDEKELFKFFKEYVSKYKSSIDSKKEPTLIKSIGFLKNKAKTLEDNLEQCDNISSKIILKLGKKI